MPSKYSEQPKTNTINADRKSGKSKRRNHKMRFLDSVGVEERDSPELPALNIPFASQTEAMSDENKTDKTDDLKKTNTKSNTKNSRENSSFQFLYKQ